MGYVNATHKHMSFSHSSAIVKPFRAQAFRLIQRKAKGSKSMAANSGMYAIVKAFASGVMEQFSNDSRKNDTKVITQTKQTGAKSVMNQSEFLAVWL